MAVIGLVPAPASAHYNYSNHGEDFASISATHGVITVCNHERDGNLVRAGVSTVLGPRYYYDRTENGVCATHDLWPRGFYWQLCEVNVGCSEVRSV